MFYALAKQEDYLKDKINLFVAMAPVLRLGNTSSKSLKGLANYKFTLGNTLKTFGIYEVMGVKWLSLVDKICGRMEAFCDMTHDFAEGDSKYNDAERADVSQGHFPHPASWKQLAHYAQSVDSGLFREFDYEEEKNMKKYGQASPPEIDVGKISHVPIAMFVGKQDPLANPTDTQWARDQIKTTIHYEEINNFDHGSFMLGKDMSFMDTVLKVVAQQVKVDKIEQDAEKSGVNIANLYGVY